jgi:outer membrane lipoprotein-sorting protein
MSRVDAILAGIAQWTAMKTWREGSWLRTGVTLSLATLLAMGLILSGSPGEAQNRESNIRRSSPRLPFQGQPLPGSGFRRFAPEDQQRAREMMRLYLRQGQRQPYQAEQRTRLFRERMIESTQIVKHQGPGRTRIEYSDPPRLQGDILLVNGGRIFKYVRRQNRILVGPVPMDEFNNRVQELLQGVMKGRITVRVVGSEQIAGQSAAIVEIRSVHGGAFFKRLWIDEKTGVRLKIEDADPLGNVISTSYFTRIDYAPTFLPRDFSPASLPNVPHEPLLPDTLPLPSVQAAQQQVPYPIHEPSLPEGFSLKGVWVVPSAGPPVTILRYTDGVITFALFQYPARLPIQAPQRKRMPPPRLIHGAARWISGDRSYFLIGNLKPESFRQIVSSLP